METIIPSPLTVRAYDNTLRKVMGTFKAPCKIGPIETIVEFHVMDITPNYNLLLGRDWLQELDLKVTIKTSECWAAAFNVDGTYILKMEFIIF